MDGGVMIIAVIIIYLAVTILQKGRYYISRMGVVGC